MNKLKQFNIYNNLIDIDSIKNKILTIKNKI